MVKNEIGLIWKMNLVAIEVFGVISKNLKNAKRKIDFENYNEDCFENGASWNSKGVTSSFAPFDAQDKEIWDYLALAATCSQRKQKK